MVTVHVDGDVLMNEVGYVVVDDKRLKSELIRVRLGYMPQDTGLKLHNSITADMSSYHAFGEINPDTTAAIIEVGFLNLDRKILTEKPDLIAKGITDGIMCFINNENIPVSITPTPTP